VILLIYGNMFAAKITFEALSLAINSLEIIKFTHLEDQKCSENCLIGSTNKSFISFLPLKVELFSFERKLAKNGGSRKNLCEKC
jgi:hypothetical protein